VYETPCLWDNRTPPLNDLTLFNCKSIRRCKYKEVYFVCVLMEGQLVFSCSSFDDGGNCTTYHIVWVPSGIDELQREDFSVWTLNARNDITEWQPQLGACPDLIDKLTGFDSEKQTPLYIEINFLSDGGAQAPKCLYEMCDYSEYCTGYLNSFELPAFLLMQFQDSEDDRRTEQRITTSTSNCVLYHISAFEGEGVRKLSIYKLKLDDGNSSRIERESEWRVFRHNWTSVAAQRVEAMKVLSKTGLQWEKRAFNIDQVVDIDAIKLASKRGVYVYRLEAVVVER